MLTYPDIDPVVFQLGPLKVHWYGLMYVLGALAAWWLGRRRAQRPGSGWTSEGVSDLVFYAAIGAVLGGRIGYMLFYTVLTPVGNGLRFWEVWKGGMSFHGGLIGVLIAVWLFGRLHKKTFAEVLDFTAPLVPLGLLAGRIGNFINAELWGRASDLPWAMVFPGERAGGIPRHPTMLYEALLEGVVLFIILWVYSNKPRPALAVSSLFLIFYGLFRMLVEFVREPDGHIGYLAFGWLTMGHVLSAPMVIIGAIMLWWAYRHSSSR